jgi:hypothetical protein
VSEREGQPLATVAQRLVSSQGSLSTYARSDASGEDSRVPTAPQSSQPAKAHLDELTDCIGAVQRQPWDTSGWCVSKTTPG